MDNILLVYLSNIHLPSGMEMCYASTVPGSATSAGHLTTGTYYVTVTDPESGTDITVTRLFYSE